MSNESWRANLLQTLQRLRKPDRISRVAVVGIGHELRGDDAAGVICVRAWRSRVEGRDHLLAVEAGPAPENVGGLLRRFRPDLIVMVDAAEMGVAPGIVRWLSWQDTTALSASTHSLPLHLVASCWQADMGCEIALLGIQPCVVSVAAPLSPAVQRAVSNLARALVGLIRDERHVALAPKELCNMEA